MTLSNQDCLEYIKSIPDNSVDLVLTDPPISLDLMVVKVGILNGVVK